MHAIEMLINLSEGTLRQIENRLDVEHGELKVVFVEDIGHVAEV